MCKGRKDFILKWEVGRSLEHVPLLLPLLRPQEQLESPMAHLLGKGLEDTLELTSGKEKTGRQWIQGHR